MGYPFNGLQFAYGLESVDTVTRHVARYGLFSGVAQTA